MNQFENRQQHEVEVSKENLPSSELERQNQELQLVVDQQAQVIKALKERLTQAGISAEPTSGGDEIKQVLGDFKRHTRHKMVG